jgi:hypothetical protein
MPWVETASRSFRARHDSASIADAERLLASLELTREQLREVFPATPGELTLVLHESTKSLWLARPVLPVAWLVTSPAARRYLGGWSSGQEIHMLTPTCLRRRASSVSGSLEMLSLTAEALYTRQVVAESNRDLSRRRGPGRARALLHWSWLLEGAARWFSGQTDHARPAIARRLHEGSRPAFPPRPADALLLGGTVIDLLVQERGEDAAVELACRLDPRGPQAALERAFGGTRLLHIEGAWRSHLARMVSAG